MILDIRYVQGRAERLPALAADLVQLPVHVLVTHGPTIRPAQRATQTIPTVMAVVTGPVGSGLVARLARPGGNIRCVGHVLVPKRWPYAQVLWVALLASACSSALMGFSHSAWQFGMLRVGVGLFAGSTLTLAYGLGGTAMPVEQRSSALAF
jgi:MFS family permease